ncbi:MAG: hypothetical protein ACR2F8_11060 [Caulobacteraceae bacterium]
MSETIVPAAATPGPAERAKALYAGRRWRDCVGAIDEALADAAGKARVDLLCLKARVLIQNLKRPAPGLGAIEAAHRLDGGDRAILETLARLRQAAGAAASAFAAHKRLYRAGDPSGRAFRGLFDTLMGRKRYAAAERLATRLPAEDPAAAGNLARDRAEIALARGDAAAAQAIIEAAAGSAGAAQLESFAVIATALKAERAAGDTMAGYRHLAVAGAAYCGSTTLGVVLGSMPAWAFAGETHWLTNARTPTLGLESILTTSVPPARWPIACRVCGAACQCFDIAFRLGLAADPVGWYAKIADRLGVENLVTADKNLQLYWERDPLFRFDHLILYKSPVQHLRSMLKQQVRQNAAAPLADNWVGANLDRWAQKYLGYLKTIRQTGRRVVVNWEAFVAEPARHMRRLSNLLDIPLDASCLEHIRLAHFIGGNTGVDVRGLKVDPRLALRASNAPDLPADLLEEAMEHPFANWMARVLDGEYRRDFP